MEVRKMMPTVRGPYRSYDIQDVNEAYRAVIEEGLPIDRAAKKFSVPASTLRDRVKGKIDIDTTRSGPKTVFSQEQEAILVQHLTVMSEVGFGYSRQETINLASDYAFHLGARDKRHPLGYDWFYAFISRWPELKVVKPRSLEAARAKCATDAVVKKYFEELQKVLSKYDLSEKPQCIFNIDEKGLSAEHKPPKIVSGKMYKAQAVTSGKAQNVTLIGCVNALGQQIPPFFIFPGKRMLDPLLDGASPGATGTVTESGWSNSETFSEYMKEHLSKYLPARNSDNFVLILYDGHKSHVTIPLIEWAIQQHIVLFVLPPHCSHILQPLDISCFGPLEKAWNSACHTHLRESGGKIITRYDVCRIACKVYLSTITASNIQTAFRKSGIFPFNPNVIAPQSTAAATAFATPASCEPEVTTEQLISAETFLDNRGGQILKNVKTAKVRKTLGKVVAGKAITEPEIFEAVKEHVQNQKRPSKSSKKIVPNKKTKANTTCNLPKSPVPGPSGINNHEDLSDSDESEASDMQESDKCIVCHHFYPQDRNKCPYLTIVKWGKCDKCDGWVHLTFCSEIRVLRIGDTFLCPNCKN